MAITPIILTDFLKMQSDVEEAKQRSIALQQRSDFRPKNLGIPMQENELILIRIYQLGLFIHEYA